MRRRAVGVVLAGGRARRMGGGDKWLLPLGGRPLLDRVLWRALPQAARLVVNANGDPARLAAAGLRMAVGGADGIPVIADGVPGRAGPLAGALAGMEWAAEHAPGVPLVATFAADSPFFPLDLVERLERALGPDRPLARAASGGRAHPVFGLWPVALRHDLRRALEKDGVRKVDAWTARHGVAEVDFPFAGPVDPFFNVNAPDDLARAEKIFAAGAEGRLTDSES